MKKFLSLLLAALCCSSLAACGGEEEISNTNSISSSAETESSDTAQESSLADIETLTDANGDTIRLTQTTEYQINGYYLCSGDGSAWSFYSDLLSVAYQEDDGKTLGSSICELGFFEASEDADGDKHLCMVIHNLLSDESSFWYVMNVQDDEGNLTGLELMLPGDPDSYILLAPKEGANGE